MAEYIEIKKMLASLVRCNKEEIDETCDILFSFGIDENNDKVILNKTLLDAYNDSKQYTYEHMEILSLEYREKALSNGRFLYRYSEIAPLVDDVNGIEYSIGPATEAYCVSVLNELADFYKTGNTDYRLKPMFTIRFRRSECKNKNDVKLSEILQLYTIKTKSIKPVSKERIKSLSSAFRFDFSYRTGTPMVEYYDISEAFLYERTLRRDNIASIEHAPMRFYNTDVLDFYEVAIETKDPFTQFISFYHIIEHFFDEIYKKKIVEKFQNEITSPEFSYKSEQKIYNLAKSMHQALKNSESNGKGNELESLKYVLTEFVPTDKLIERLNQLDPSSKDFLQGNPVTFANETKTKIAWNDINGVYTNLAKRIYETRNALVHSKSEQSKKRYNPHKDRRSLLKEVILIQSVAELVIINSSKII